MALTVVSNKSGAVNVSSPFATDTSNVTPFIVTVEGGEFLGITAATEPVSARVILKPVSVDSML